MWPMTPNKAAIPQAVCPEGLARIAWNKECYVPPKGKKKKGEGIAQW